jgi:hypothetical protein
VRSFVSVAGWFVVLASLITRAEGAGRPISLTGDATCPSSVALAAALGAIFPDLEMDGADALRVTVEEIDGARYRVSAGTASREFVDTPRRCDERAKKAAVFVALELAPPMLSTSPSRPRTSRQGLQIELEAAGVYDSAPSAAAYAGGGRLAIYLGTRHVGGALGIAGLSSMTLELMGARARLSRVPIDLSARGQLRLHRVGLALDLGLVVAPQITSGLDVPASRTEVRVEFGLRLACHVEVWLGRVAPFAMIQTEYVPAPFNLTLPAGQVVGTTPSYFLGAEVGIVVRLL